MGRILGRFETGLRVLALMSSKYTILFSILSTLSFFKGSGEVLLYMPSGSCPVQAQGDPQITVMFTDIVTGEQSGGKTTV